MRDTAARLVIWDHDGVIADSGRHFYEVLNFVCKGCSVKRKWGNYDSFRHWVSGSLRDTIESLGLLPEQVDVAEATYKAMLLTANIEPVEGIRAPLDVVRDAGIPQIVVSANRSNYMRAWYAQHDLAGFFEGIYGTDNLRWAKPDSKAIVGDAQGVRAVHTPSGENLIRPGEIIGIGDMVEDIRFYAAAKVEKDRTRMESIAATYGWNSPKRFRDAAKGRDPIRADHSANCTESLATILEQLLPT